MALLGSKPRPHQQLRKTLSTLPKPVIEAMLEFLCFPVLKLLERNEETEECLETLVLLLSSGTIDVRLRTEVLTVLSSIAFPEKIKLSEESKLSLVKSINFALTFVSTSAFQPLLAHVISVLISYLPTFKALTLESLHTLRKIIAQLTGEHAAQFLPGVMSGVYKVVRGGSGREVVSEGLMVMEEIISKSLSDLPSLSSYIPLSIMQSVSIPMATDPKILRTSAWHIKTAKTLTALLPPLLPLRTSPSISVRQALLSLLKALPFSKLGFESLLLFLSDSDLKETARVVVDTMRDEVELESNLALLLRYPKTPDSLLILVGYLSIMGTRSKAILEESMSPFVATLLPLLIPHAVPKATIATLDAPELRYDDGVIDSMRVLCEVVVQICGEGFLREVKSRAGEVGGVVLLNFVCEPSELVVLYLDPDFGVLPERNAQHGADKNESVKTDRIGNKNDSRDLIRRIKMEGLASAVSGLTSTERGYMLMDGLYPILEHFGDRNEGVRTSAAKVLQNLSTYEGRESISDLILQNSDYLIDAIAHKLRYVSLHPLSILVLNATVQICGITIFDRIGECVYQILDILDEFGSGGGMVCDDLVGVLKEIVAVVPVICEGAGIGLLDPNFIPSSIVGLSNPAIIEANSHSSPFLKCSFEMQEFVLRERKITLEESDCSKGEKIATAKEFFTTRLESPSPSQSKDSEYTPDVELDTDANEDTAQGAEEETTDTDREILIISIVNRIFGLLSSSQDAIRIHVLQVLQRSYDVVKSENILQTINFQLLNKRLNDKNNSVIIETLKLYQVIITRSRISKQQLSPLITTCNQILMASLSLQASQHQAVSKSRKHQTELIHISVDNQSQAKVELLLTVLKTFSALVRHHPQLLLSILPLSQLLDLLFLPTSAKSAPLVSPVILSLQQVHISDHIKKKNQTIVESVTRLLVLLTNSSHQDYLFILLHTKLSKLSRASTIISDAPIMDPLLLTASPTAIEQIINGFTGKSKKLLLDLFGTVKQGVQR